MRLWLIRHAEAANGPADAARPLSSKGERQTDALARFLHRVDLAPPTEIWHSPLLRARLTAERLARGAGWSTTVLSENPSLLPYDDVALVAEEFADGEKDLAVVGHQPHLGRLGSWLITGDPEAEAFLMKKGAILVLETRSAAALFRRWSVAWMVTPEVLEKE